MWQKRETIRVKVNRWEPMAVTGRLNSIIRRDEQFSLVEDEEDGRPALKLFHGSSTERNFPAHGMDN